jgi:transglycosylase-like protein
MNEYDRPAAETKVSTMPAAPSLRERLPAALIALLVSSAFVAALFTALPAQGTGGGVGPAGIQSSSQTSTSYRGTTSPRYMRLWRHLRPAERQWAYRVSECESGGRARLHGGGGYYHGAFMFLRSSWVNAPKSPGGDPHRYSWITQAVVSVHLKRQLGTKPWPVCG